MLTLLPVIASIEDRLAALGEEALRRQPQLKRLLEDLAQWIVSDVNARQPADRIRGVIAEQQAGLDDSASWERIITTSLLSRLRDLVDLSRDCRALTEAIGEGRSISNVDLAFHSEAGAAPVRHRIAAWRYGRRRVLRPPSDLLRVLDRHGVAGRRLSANDGGGGLLLFRRPGRARALHPQIRPGLAGRHRGRRDLFVRDHSGDLPYRGSDRRVGADFPALWFPDRPARHGGHRHGARGQHGDAARAAVDLLADFASFANSAVAFFVGVIIAELVTRIARGVGAEWIANRLVLSSWVTIAVAAERRGKRDRAEFAGLMLHRLGLLVQRIAFLSESDRRDADSLVQLRIGINIIDLRRARYGLAAATIAVIDDMLDQLAIACRTYGGGGMPREL